MATQENLNLAQQLYVAYYGRPADAAGLEFWANDIEANGVDSAISAFGTSEEYTARFGELNNDELVNGIYQQAFGRDAEAEGLEFWTGKLESGELDLATIALAVVQGASDSDLPDATTLANKVAAADLYTAAAGDAHSGTAADEYSAEKLAEINADTDLDSLDINEWVEGIPSDGGNGGEGGGEGNTSNTTDINFDNVASGDSEVEGYEAEVNDTDGTDVRNIGKIEWDEAGQVATSSKDYTFNLANQLGAGEQYNGTFLSPVLSAESRSQNSQLFIDLLDLRQPAGSNEPLGELPYNGFTFTVDGEDVVLQSEEIFEAKSYNELLTATNNALNTTDEPLLEGFNAELGGEFTVFNQSGESVTGRTLVLTDSNGRTLETGSFTNSEDATDGGFTLYGEQSTEAPENIEGVIATNLDLDNVGYGSQGGSINLFGESNSDKGIEQMNVEADNTVWLTRLESNNGSQQFLKEINLEGEGAFHVGQQDNDNVIGLPELLTTGAAAGLVDVQDFNGGNYNGNIKLNGVITEGVVGRDLDDKDDNVDPKNDNATFTYTTAAGDDQVSLVLSDELMAREDANVDIVTGAGDDVVETIILDDFDFLDDADLTDQQLNANLNISTGTGNDVVTAWGAGDAVISTGEGNDVVYADNIAILDFGRDRWEFNSTAAAGVPTDVSNSDVELSDFASEVDQTFSVEEDASIQVRVSFKGHDTAWVNVPSTDGGDNGDTVSTLQVNQAIKGAVNNDRVVSNLLEAFDGDGNILNIESLIDGNNLDALDIAFRDINEETDSANGLAAMDDIYGTDALDAGAAVGQLSGSDSVAESDNTINVGSGDDVVVMGTGEFSNDTLVLDNNFGTNDIVNFTTGDADGFDILDFTSYGVNGASVAAGDYAVGNDEVSVTTFDAGDFDDAENFSDLSANDISEVIGSADNGRVDSIVMVEAGSSGVHKVFDINSSSNSDEYTVELVGILDFGNSLAGQLDDANIA